MVLRRQIGEDPSGEIQRRGDQREVVALREAVDAGGQLDCLAPEERAYGGRVAHLGRGALVGAEADLLQGRDRVACVRDLGEPS